MANDFLDYEGWRVTNFVRGVGVITVDAIVDSSPTGCLRCGRLAVFLQKHGSKTRKLADIPVRGQRVTISFQRQRFICLGCGATMFQPLPGVTGNKQMTDRLVRDIGIKAVAEPFVKVAKETGLSAKTIKTVFMENAARVLDSRNLKAPYSLGIDDVYVDRVARCVLVDNETNGLYDLLPRRNKTFLNRFLLKIPDRDLVKVVTIDMSAPFRDAILNALPNAIVVIDRFHIQRLANEAAKKVLRSVRRRRTSGKKGVRDPFLLLRASDDLSEKNKTDMDRWLEEEPVVYQAYKLKEAFLNIWNVRDRRQAEALYDEWLTQIPSELVEAFRSLTTAMKNWRIEVFNYWDHRYTNAACESHNRIIKDIQRRGQSYDFETVRTKALLRDAQRHEKLKIAVNSKTTSKPLSELQPNTLGLRAVTNTKTTAEGESESGRFQHENPRSRLKRNNGCT